MILMMLNLTDLSKEKTLQKWLVSSQKKDLILLQILLENVNIQICETKTKKDKTMPVCHVNYELCDSKKTDVLTQHFVRKSIWREQWWLRLYLESCLDEDITDKNENDMKLICKHLLKQKSYKMFTLLHQIRLRKNEMLFWWCIDLINLCINDQI